MQTETLQAEYDAVSGLLRTGDAQRALPRADGGLHRSDANDEWRWKFRLLKAESLLAAEREKEALDLLNGAGSPPTADLKVRRLMHQSRASYLLSDYASAGKFMREARSLADANGSPSLIAELDLREAPLLMQNGRLADAEAILRQGLSRAQKVGDAYLEANLMGNLGVLFTVRSRFEDAISWFQAALERSERLGATGQATTTIGNLGWCYLNLGDHEKALASFDEAAARSAKSGNKSSEQTWVGDSGDVLMETGDLSSAQARYERALAIARELKDGYWSASWLNSLSQIGISAGRLDDAEKLNAESVAMNKEIKNRANALGSQLNAARLHVARKSYDEAETLFHAALNATAKNAAEASQTQDDAENPGLALDAQEGLADLYKQTGQYAKAEQQFQSAIDAIKSQQAALEKADHQITYFSKLARFYRNYVDFLLDRGETEKALAVIESSRARLLTKQVNNGKADELMLTAPQLHELAKSSNRVLLSFWVTPKRSYVFTVAGNKLDMCPLPAEHELRELVDGYRTVIEDLRDPLESENPLGRRLSQILLAPVRQLVPPGSHVVIVPDGALHDLNFAALPSPDDPRKYWIQDVTISIAPSLTLLSRSRSGRQSNTAGLLAIGDPEGTPQEFPRLPNAGKEMERISELFPSSRETVFQGAQSQPSAYRKANPERFSFIHFAAHATANRGAPLDSALILSPEGSSYSLSARDIMKVPLNATLVTLSSCRGAGARAYSGEGMVGLSWAFLQAGARNVVAGLWDVSDESTSQLMARMYSELLKGAPPDDALRTSQLALVNAGSAYSKPYYWAPFQLYSRAQ